MISAGPTLKPQSSLWTPEPAQLVTCPSSCLPVDLDPPASATYPSACLSLSTSCPRLPGVCHSAHQTHSLPPNPGPPFSVTTKEKCGLCGHHSLSWPRLNITICLSRVPVAPQHPPHSPEASSLAGSKGFYLRNQVSAMYLLPKMSKQSPRKSLDTSVKMCVQGCSQRNCL